MRGLLYKEFVVMKPWIWLLLVFQVVVTVTCMFTGNLYGVGDETVMIHGMCYFLMFFIAGTMNAELFRNDEKQLWQSFVGSTPQGFRGQIQSKYYIILIVNLVVMLTCFVTDCAVILMLNDMGSSATAIIYMIFCVMLIGNAIELPFIIRFGSANGLNIKLCMIILVPLLIGLYALFGDISMFLGKDFLEVIKAIFSTATAIWIQALLPFAAMGLYYGSYRLSLKLYRKGAEVDE